MIRRACDGGDELSTGGCRGRWKGSCAVRAREIEARVFMQIDEEDEDDIRVLKMVICRLRDTDPV